MSKLRRLTLFLLAFAIGLCGLHLAIGNGLRRIRTGMFGAYNRAAAGAVNADLIVTGSSRALVHYDPAILTRTTGMSAFNLGRIGAGANAHTAILRAYLHNNRRPRLLIENADLSTLQVISSLVDPPEYTPYLDEPGLYNTLLRRYPQIRRMRYLPLYGYVVNDAEFRHYLGLKAWFGIQPPEDYENGFQARHELWLRTFDRIKASGQRFHFEPEPEGVRDFEALLADARSRGIAAVVVFSPVYREYLDLVDGRTELMSAIAAAAARQKARFVDFSSFMPIAGSTEYFVDHLHMNSRGAAAFSEALGKWLLWGGSPDPRPVP